jgi:hypothetical protein
MGWRSTKKSIHMLEWSSSRLTVLGPAADVEKFQSIDWLRILEASRIQELEFSEGLYICLIEFSSVPIKELQTLSKRWRSLIFLLDYHLESERIKGLAKAQAGQINYCQFQY